MRRIHDFHGGIHPPENKQQSLTGPIRDAGIPEQLVLPLSQHIGASAKPVVSIGERVFGGQKIAEANGLVSVPCHAPTSATVVAIEERAIPHPSGYRAPCIVLQTDGRDEWQALEPVADYRSVAPSELVQLIHDAGIAGMGGAGFPTAVKVTPGPARTITTLIINGTECEPYITSDDSLMREQARALVGGTQILAHLLGVDDIVIGIEDNKPDALAAVRAAAAESSISVTDFPTKYPSGGEKQLIEVLLGKQVPSGGLPADIGVICQNVGTAVAVHEAITLGQPLTSRITTVTGQAARKPGNFRVLLGTPMQHLLTLADVDTERASRLVMGGPMMGITVPGGDCPVIKTTNCLLVPTEEELPLPPPAQACIRCGLCAEACPASLLPQQLFWFAQGKEHDKLERHNLFDCIECGACSYVCPSNIPLVQYYRASKAEILDQRREHAKAEHARERFEARQARIDRLTAEKVAKREARKQAAASRQTKDANGPDPIQAAIERAKARKASLAASEADPPSQIAQLEASVDTCRKRLAKAQEKLAAADGGDPDLALALAGAVTKTAEKLAAAEAALLQAKASAVEEA